MNKEVKVIWEPQEGSQELFLSCPITEILYHGTRGGCGKSDALLMKYLQYVGAGFKKSWLGVIIRREFADLEDIVKKSKKWIPLIFPSAEWKEAKYKWVFDDGEELHFRHGHTEEHYMKKFHGHEIPFIGFEELTCFSTSDFYDSVKSCNRCSDPGVPRIIASTTNPYGLGHSWVKKYFKIGVVQSGKIIVDESGNRRVHLHGSIYENKILLKNDPDYINRLKGIKNPAKRKAWLFGDWDIKAGGYFEEYWNPKYNIVEPFEIPKTWKIYRSYDHGLSKPFSVGFWAVSDGCDIKISEDKTISTIKGDCFRINEYYGCTREENTGLRLTASTIARNIKRFEERYIKRKVLPGPADSAIYTIDDEDSIADKMRYEGIDWIKCKKGPNSRQNGWLIMGEMMDNAKTRESKGLFIFRNCEHFLRTVPGLLRDQKDMDDIDTEQEDHIADEARYFLNWNKPTTIIRHGII